MQNIYPLQQDGKMQAMLFIFPDLSKCSEELLQVQATHKKKEEVLGTLNTIGKKYSLDIDDILNGVSDSSVLYISKIGLMINYFLVLDTTEIKYKTINDYIFSHDIGQFDEGDLAHRLIRYGKNYDSLTLYHDGMSAETFLSMFNEKYRVIDKSGNIEHKVERLFLITSYDNEKDRMNFTLFDKEKGVHNRGYRLKKKDGDYILSEEPNCMWLPGTFIMVTHDIKLPDNYWDILKGKDYYRIINRREKTPKVKRVIEERASAQKRRKRDRERNKVQL